MIPFDPDRQTDWLTGQLIRFSVFRIKVDNIDDDGSYKQRKESGFYFLASS